MTTKEAQIALANLKRYISGGGAVDRGTNRAIDMAIKALEKPEPHWIPVTERLPDVGCEVLVEMDDKVTISVGYIDPCGWWFVDFSTEERDDVIAWMPLPEPYKEVTP